MPDETVGFNPERPLPTPLQDLATRIKTDIPTRNLIFEALGRPSPKGPDKANPLDQYKKEYSDALRDLWEGSPTDQDFHNRIFAANTRIRTGHGQVVAFNPKLKAEHYARYQGITNEFALITKRIYAEATPVSPKTKDAIMTNMQRVAGNTEVDPRYASYLDRQIIAAARQKITPEEAQKILQLEREYYQKLKINELHSSPRYIEAKAVLAKRAKEGVQTESTSHSIARRPDALLAEKAQIPEEEDHIEAFQKFITRHREQLAQQSQNGKLADYIYDNFYGRDDELKKYITGTPELAQLKNKLDANWKQREQQLVHTPYPLTRIDQGIWQFYINQRKGTISNLPNSEIGRFYINTSGAATVDVFIDLARMIGYNNLHCDVKMARTENINADYLNRADKIVLYFNKADQDRALQSLQAIGLSHRGELGGARPRFTVGVKDAQGNEMPGVGFGQDPASSVDSFGTQRARLLSQMYQESMAAPGYNFQEAFKRLAPQYNVNPEHPAFNFGTWGETNYPPQFVDQLTSSTGKLAPTTKAA